MKRTTKPKRTKPPIWTRASQKKALREFRSAKRQFEIDKARWESTKRLERERLAEDLHREYEELDKVQSEVVRLTDIISQAKADLEAQQGLETLNCIDLAKRLTEMQPSNRTARAGSHTLEALTAPQPTKTPIMYLDWLNLLINRAGPKIVAIIASEAICQLCFGSVELLTYANTVIVPSKLVRGGVILLRQR